MKNLFIRFFTELILEPSEGFRMTTNNHTALWHGLIIRVPFPTRQPQQMDAGSESSMT